jgi:hypothetical protein
MEILSPCEPVAFSFQVTGAAGQFVQEAIAVLR